MTTIATMIFFRPFHDAASVDGELDTHAEALLIDYVRDCVEQFISDVDLLQAIEEAEQAPARWHQQHSITESNSTKGDDDI